MLLLCRWCVRGLCRVGSEEEETSEVSDRDSTPTAAAAPTLMTQIDVHRDDATDRDAVPPAVPDDGATHDVTASPDKKAVLSTE